MTRVPEHSEERSALDAVATGARRKATVDREGHASSGSRCEDVTHRGLPDIYGLSGRTADTDDPSEGSFLLNPSREERFRVLYEQHVGQLARYVSRRTPSTDVQDVVADAFLTAWRRFDDLPHDPLPWLFVTARKLIANRHRSTERRGALYDKLKAEAPMSSQQAAHDLSDIDRRLLAAISELPDAEREAFMLVAWDGLDRRRAARAAGCSAATFRMRLHRARRRLKNEIGPERPFVQLADIQLEETR